MVISLVFQAGDAGSIPVEEYFCFVFIFVFVFLLYLCILQQKLSSVVHKILIH